MESACFDGEREHRLCGADAGAGSNVLSVWGNPFVKVGRVVKARRATARSREGKKIVCRRRLGSPRVRQIAPGAPANASRGVTSTFTFVRLSQVRRGGRRRRGLCFVRFVLYPPRVASVVWRGCPQLARDGPMLGAAADAVEARSESAFPVHQTPGNSPGGLLGK